MQEKFVFREMLSEIKALADTKGNCLTVEEIKEFFANAHLQEEHFQLVYEYLQGQKIKVVGYEGKGAPEEPAPEPEKEQQNKENPRPADPEEEYLSMYLADLEGIAPATEEEELDLFQRAAAGDKIAKSRLIELHLRTVYEAARTYLFGELPQSDLIQEGNVGLMLAMDQLQEKADLREYRKDIYETVRGFMEEALTQKRDLRDLDEEIADRVNHINEAVHNLERDLDHKVSQAELSAYLEMPLEEIRDILRIAGDEIEITVEEHHHKPDEKA